MSITLPRPPEWQASALCAQGMDPEIWMPTMAPGKNTSMLAKKLCGLCEVREQCLAWALDIEREDGSMFGIYGGATQRERQNLRNARACGHCGQTFAAAKSWQRTYCSEGCWAEATGRRVGGAA